MGYYYRIEGKNTATLSIEMLGIIKVIYIFFNIREHYERFNEFSLFIYIDQAIVEHEDWKINESLDKYGV